MRIAQVSPLYESVPPRGYGGTERIVSYLTEELVRQGHDVTLYASGDSDTSARLVSACRRSLRLDERCIDPLPHHILMLEKVFRAADDFDVIHFHTDNIHFPLSRRSDSANVTTLHGRMDIPDLVTLYREFVDMPLISISHAQRDPLPWANWKANIYHGLPTDLYRFHPEPGEYLAFLGRISPEKRVDRAVRIALKSGVPLKIAAKIDPDNMDYYHEVAEPMFRHPLVEFVGEIAEHEKEEFLGNARGLLFPIDWPEPFGLVMIEAMASGTPVIAYPKGSVLEVMEDGRTGFIVPDVAGAIEAVGRLSQIDRRECRRAFDERFTVERMARTYVDVYEHLGAAPVAELLA